MSRKLIILLVSVGVIALLGMKATTAKTSNASRLVITEPTPLELHLERLVWAESSGREKIRVLDVNNKYSYGCLQFQLATFESYSTRYGLEGDIYDCEFQKLLALKMLQENYGNWKHWYLSHKKIGLPPRI